jgi:Uncharacterised nucleotidyltransferase
MSLVTRYAPQAYRAALREWLLGRALPCPAGLGDGHALVDEAARQGLLGLLASSLDTAVWPSELRSRIALLRDELLFRGVQQLDLLSRTRELLAREGLRSLPLKGAALAEALYASVADRPMWDVDLLAIDDFGASLRVVGASGLRLVDRSDHAVAFCDPRGVVLELHQSVTSCPGLFRDHNEAVWDRSRDASGQVERLPSAEDLLVQLGLHAAFQHGLALSLVQYLDFRRLLERPLDASRAAALAWEAGAAPALAAALAAAVVLVGATVPEPLRSALAPALAARDRRWLAGWLSDPVSVLAPSEPPLARLRWMLAAGRRRRLLQGTLRGRGDLGRARRALGLASRWGGASVRQLLGAARRPSA